MNIILVQLVGIYGILLSTILALTVITYPWQTWMIHKKLFHCSMWGYLKKLAVYTMITLAACAGTYWICEKIPGKGILNLILRLIVCMIVPNVIFLVTTFKMNEFNESLRIVKRIMER